MAVGLVLALAPAAAAQTLPTLALVPPADDPVVLGSYDGQVLLDLGVFVEAQGADLELRTARPDYDTAPQTVLVEAATGLPVQAMPRENTNGWRGLRRFFRVTIERPDGTPVLTLYRQFCPNTYARTRMDDSGPTVPHYPTVCRSFSPFMKGMVWGIEQGWAVAGFSPDEFTSFRRQLVTLAPGEYHVTVEIMPFFQAFFGIAPEDGEASFNVVVVRGGFGVRAPAEGRLAPTGDVPDDPNPDPDTVPDLVALPAWAATLRSNRGHDYLSFASTAWNGGPAPLMLEGFRRPGTTTMDAYQYFFDSHGEVVGRTAVGTFDYDTRRGHNHWHILQFARYSIVDAKTNEVVRSRKQSYCLAATDPIDLTVAGANLTPYEDQLSSVCGDRQAHWIREALPTGWGDTYYQGVAGQAFGVTSLPNGRYRMRVTVNPLGLLYETNAANNVEDRYFVLKGRKGHRSIEVEPWHGVIR